MLLAGAMGCRGTVGGLTRWCWFRQGNGVLEENGNGKAVRKVMNRRTLLAAGVSASAAAGTSIPTSLSSSTTAVGDMDRANTSSSGPHWGRTGFYVCCGRRLVPKARARGDWWHLKTTRVWVCIRKKHHPFLPNMAYLKTPKGDPTNQPSHCDAFGQRVYRVDLKKKRNSTKKRTLNGEMILLCDSNKPYRIG